MEKKIKKKKVLIVDDSAVMRKFLTDIISSSKEFEVIATAMDPFFAAHKIQTHNPDIIILDTDMPKMDGITFLKKIMSTNPMPVVMVSDDSPDSAKKTIQSLKLGAIDFIIKPAFSEIAKKETLIKFSDKLIKRLIEASESNIKKYDEPVEIFQKIKTDRKKIISNQIIAIGASAGGVQVIYDIIYNMPSNIHGIIIAQHMPEDFTKAFADSLNDMSKLHVKELDKNERVHKGHVYIAPGNKHIVLKKDHMGYFATLDDSDPVNRHKPSIDMLFHSVAKIAGTNATGIILTGMGEDGVRGLLDMKESGAMTIAQDKESSSVFGMPARAIEIGAATRINNIVEIINYLSGIVFNES